ncbi:unnamed protein product [Nippostrongylus brasiliensis]|uniref:Uncharacterized protein n=1 Tax=Nippostrongylus brasiliensis TaxID=27835 RepID=A0A0N4YA22_NIPBR|nr:unnamed protein product [Nippostrongylus brasiliensis]
MAILAKKSCVLERLLRAEGFSRRSFAPPISMPKAIAHEKKLKELNIVNGLLYPVGIRPSSSVTLNSIELGTLNTEGQQMDSRCLLTFAHWMQIVGKQQTFKKTAVVLE